MVKKVTLLGVPSHWGVGIKDLTNGPSLLREHGVIEKLSSAGLSIEDAGDIDCKSEKAVIVKNPRMRYVDEVADVSNATAKKVHAIIMNERVPVVIGGDHSVDIGAISGASKALKGNLGLIYIDEHGDLNTGRSTDSGNIHGMALSAIMGIGDKKISAVSGTPVKKENILHVGGNEFDLSELELIESYRIETVKLIDIVNDGMRPVIEAIERLSKKVRGVWVSLDIDAIDAADAPGVTMPDRFGLSYREVSMLARHIGKHVNVVGVTVAEYNHRNDDKGKTLELVTELIASFLGGEYSWYRANWMTKHTSEMIHHDILSAGGLLDVYAQKLETASLAKQVHRWKKTVRVFLEGLARPGVQKKETLPVEYFAQLVGFSEFSRPRGLAKSSIRDIFWRSSEDIKNDTCLGMFQIDVTKLPEEEARQLHDYFVHTVYGPLYNPAAQAEIIQFLSQIRRQQYKELDEIKIGILHSLSGTMAISETSLVDASLMAVDEINAQGGVNGRTLKPFIVDGASDPERFAAEAKELITKRGVSAVFGGWTSASRKMMKPIFEQYDSLLWYPVQYEGLEESKNIIYVGAAPNQQIVPAIEWAVKTLGKKFFLVGSDYVFPRSANRIIAQRVQELGGTIVGEEYQVLGSKDFKEIVKKIKGAKPDVILNTINGDSNIAFFDSLRRIGITSAQVPTISFSISEEEISDMNLDNVIGDYAVWNYFQSIRSPVNANFVKRFKERYGEHRVTTDPIEAAYAAVHLYAQALQKAGDKPADIRKVLGELSFDAPGGTIEIDAKSQHATKWARIGKVDIDGQFEIVWQSKKKIHATSFPQTLSQPEWNQYLDSLYVGWDKHWSRP